MSCSILCLFISFAEKIPKMKISKILVPVDFSDISINALRYAAAFACASGAGITILHIADPDSIMNDIKGNLAPEHMIELLKAENYMKGIKTESVIKKGKVADLILAEAEKSEAGLIVMGTQGAGTLSRNLVGTNTTKVVGKSKCPVLAIPEEASYTTVRRVVLAVDLHHRALELQHDVARDRGHAHGAHLADRDARHRRADDLRLPDDRAADGRPGRRVVRRLGHVGRGRARSTSAQAVTVRARAARRRDAIGTYGETVTHRRRVAGPGASASETA